jgi:predicted O-methyltransferase YrrM
MAGMLIMSNYLSESLHKDTDRYILSLMSPPMDVLARMEEYAMAHDFPFVGPLVGQMLGILARSTGATRIFEMGSGFGYSAVQFGQQMPPEGRIICTDGDAANRERAIEYFRAAGLDHKIDFLVGDAIEIVAGQTGLFDIIFMDIDKEQYPRGLEAGWPKLKTGGLFIADNLFWHSRVLGDDARPSTQGMREFTRMIFQMPDAKSTIIPLRDGVSLTLKTA